MTLHLRLVFDFLPLPLWIVFWGAWGVLTLVTRLDRHDVATMPERLGGASMIGGSVIALAAPFWTVERLWWAPPWIFAAGVVATAALLAATIVVMIGLARHIGASQAARRFGRLAASGAYGLVRHPAYLGITLAGWTTALPAGRPLALGAAAVMTAGALLRLWAEERRLRLLHKAAHAAYCAQVPAFLPFPRPAPPAAPAARPRGGSVPRM